MASSANKSTGKHSDEPDSKDQARPNDGSVTAKPASSHQSASSSSPRLLQRASTTPILSSTSSATPSPKPSRETSPIRHTFKSGSAAASRGSRSRKNSQDLSPNRAPASNIPAVPSAASIQRALSAAGTPQLQSPAIPDFPFDATRPQKPAKGGSNPLGANLPRVKSPPPTTSSNKSSIYSPRKSDQASAPPSIVVERPTPTSGSNAGIDEAEEGNLVASGMRTPGRGPSGGGPTLETVQESSVPATPAIGNVKTQIGGKPGSDGRPQSIAENPMEEAFAKETKTRPESGNESGGNKSTEIAKESKDARRPEVASTPKPPIMHAKRSFSQLHPAKGKSVSEGSVKNMTVETETVSTIPQVALGGGAGERTAAGRAEPGGSLRLKPSSETIRPRKEKKKVVRKAPSITSGTGGSLSRRLHHHHIYAKPPSPENFLLLSTVVPNVSLGHSACDEYPQSTSQSSNRGHKHRSSRSFDVGVLEANQMRRSQSPILTNFRSRAASSKADIFEAKVASAVDEVNSSDSEETFVYESNPPEPISARPHRFHSRTPSATSTASQMDQYGAKSRQDGHHSIAGKKSMKFANNSYHTNVYPGESNDGTVRGPNQGGRPAGSNASHHHHIGRYGRGGHTSLFDNESPFPNAARLQRTTTTTNARQTSRPSSPRSSHVVRVSGNLKKLNEPMSYDLEGEGADDERTPLVGSLRSGRNRYSRRPASAALRNGYSAEEKGYRLCRSFTAFVSLGTLLALLIAAIVVILLMCSKPLYDVRVKDIRNVLASEQEIMFDINVYAINPNLISLQVSDLDVNVFAKSKYVGTNALWRSGQNQRMTSPKARSNRAREATSQGIQYPPKRSSHAYRPQDNVDEGTDPIEDPETDAQTMLLGRIFEFDSPLIFDPSPIRRHHLSSIGEVQLARPGNRTEEGGTERWEKVIQHDFELIVRGVLKYSIPIISKIRSVSISGHVIVHPGGGEERMHSMASSTSSQAPIPSRA